MKKYENCKIAYKTDNNGVVEFLRLIDGKCDEIKRPISDRYSRIFGFNRI